MRGLTIWERLATRRCLNCGHITLGFGLCSYCKLLSDKQKKDDLLERALEELEYMKKYGIVKPNPPRCDGDPSIVYVIFDIKKELS